MENLTAFNRLVVDSSPFWQKIAVLKVDMGYTNQVIAKKVVVVHRVDH